MKYLLDTCVLSELQHPLGDASVKRRVLSLGDPNVCVSVLSLGEINKGIHLLADGARKRELSGWLKATLALFYDRIVPFMKEDSLLWGELTARASQKGSIVPAVDAQLAATALQNRLTVVTRNIKHFQMLEVPLFNPWEPH